MDSALLNLHFTCFSNFKKPSFLCPMYSKNPETKSYCCKQPINCFIKRKAPSFGRKEGNFLYSRNPSNPITKCYSYNKPVHCFPKIHLYFQRIKEKACIFCQEGTNVREGYFTYSRNPHKSTSRCYSCNKPIISFPNLPTNLRKEITFLFGQKGCNVPEGSLQNGGFGAALLSATSSARVTISPFVAALMANPTFVSGMLAWAAAQSSKVVLNFFLERKWDLKIMFASGGMPSSHSALCTALTTSVAICHGVADSLFPVCLGFSLIVMYDAIGVRRHAGMQAQVLNMIVEDLFQGHPISQRKLKELLGHTPSQVVAGAMLGIAVACFCCQGRLVAA